MTIDPFKKLDPVNLHQAKEIVKLYFSINWTPNLISDPVLEKVQSSGKSVKKWSSC